MSSHITAAAADVEMSDVTTGRSLADASTWGGSEKAAQRFRAWEAAGGTGSLDVSFCELTSLPVELGQLHTLRGVDCSSNRLTSLPAELGQLHALEDFWCHHNQLTSLPAELGQLHALERINCSDNQLTSLPVEMGQLLKLSFFYCSWNDLTSLPLQLAQLHETCVFNCEHNAFPEGEPTTLAELRVRWDTRTRVKAARA